MVTVKRIIQATTLVTAITLVVKALGFVEKILLAQAFGTGMEVDAYLVAFGIPFSAYVVLREVVKPAFLPPFLRALNEAPAEAWRLFAVVGTVLLVLLGAITLAGTIWAAPLVSLSAPGFAGEQRALAIRLTRLAMPALLLLGLSTLTTAALHAKKRFARPALGDAAFRLGPIVILLAAGSVPGMAIGAVCGALSKVLLEGLGLGQKVRDLRPSLDLAFEPVRRVGRLAAPLLAALSLSLFVAPLVENAFASRVGVGSVTALAFARKIAETLTTILPYTLGLVLLPFSTEMTASEDGEAVGQTLLGAVRALTLIFLPATLGLMLLRVPFIRLLFERGAFTATSTEITAGPLLFYALALLPFALEVVVIQFFFARQDTRTPVLADIGAFVLNVALIPILMHAFGLGGIALAAALAKALKVLVLLILFQRREPALRIGSLLPFCGKLVIASLGTVLLLIAWLEWGPDTSASGFVGLAGYLGIGGLLGGGMFFGLAYLLRIRELHILRTQAAHWLHMLRKR